MKIHFPVLLVALCSLILFNASAQSHKRASHKTNLHRKTENKIRPRYGVASFYAKKFAGRKMTNGETYRPEKLTAACNVLPLNTWIKVTNLRNHQSVVVKIKDRMNPKNKRLVDLSRSAASKLGYLSRGLTRVKVEVLADYKPSEQE